MENFELPIRPSLAVTFYDVIARSEVTKQSPFGMGCREIAASFARESERFTYLLLAMTVGRHSCKTIAIVHNNNQDNIR